MENTRYRKTVLELRWGGVLGNLRSCEKTGFNGARFGPLVLLIIFTFKHFKCHSKIYHNLHLKWS